MEVELKTRDVSTPGPGWKEDEDKHELAYALRKGRPEMVRLAKRFKFMKPNPGEMELVMIGGQGTMMDTPGGVSVSTTSTNRESFSVYDLRLERADLPNPWRTSIEELACLPFADRIKLEGWDQELMGENITDAEGRLVERVDGWVDDFDGEGRSMDQWASEAFEHGLFEGLTFGFVDNDPREFASAADRQQRGGRPYCTLFRRRDVRRITLEERDGKPRLLQVVLFQPFREVDVTDPNNWRDETVDAFKVVTAGNPDGVGEERMVTARVYVQSEKDGWVEDESKRSLITPDDPSDELTEIPLAPLYIKRTAPYRGESPFLDTAWTQNAIWNHNSELSGLAREAALTRVHISGYDPAQSVSKPNQGDTRSSRFTFSDEAQSRMQIGEFKGSAARMIIDLIKWKSENIRKAHHRLSSDKPTQPVTAREITLEGVHASSALEMWVIFQERGWKHLLDWMALLGGHQQRGTVEIPHDFGLPNSGVERNQENYAADHMFAGNYWREAIRAGDVDERSFDIDVEIRLQVLRLSSEMGVAERIASGDVSILDRLIAIIKGEPVPVGEPTLEELLEAGVNPATVRAIGEMPVQLLQRLATAMIEQADVPDDDEFEDLDEQDDSQVS